MKYQGVKDNGKSDYKYLGVQGYHLNDFDKNDPRDVLVPCKKCIGCRLDYSRRWADRLMLELDHSKTALFFTLTYDDDHITHSLFVPELNKVFGTLVKEDIQLFNKRLRKYFSHKEIRFFTAGEYGDCTLRPHYHGIYFGLSLDDFPDCKLLFLNNNKQPIYTSDILSKIWKNGHVSIGAVSWQSAAYVARYNLKKLGSGYDNYASERMCLPEFALMSRNPGIGAYFPIDHPEIFDNPRDKIVISDPYGVRSVGQINMPSFIFEKLSLVNPELYGIIKEEKKLANNERFFEELSKTDLDEFDYLCLKESRHEACSKSLIRPLE